MFAVVTGATAGIGAGFARRLSQEGYDLLLVARDPERLAKTAAELGDAQVLAADLSTPEGCDAVVERLGSTPVDLLVNNAGLGLNRGLLDNTLEREEYLLRLNVHAVLRLTMAVLPGMADRGSGDILNVSSIAGFGPVMPGSTYSASKAWVTNFSESIGALARPFGVRVMALCPGYTRTEFHERAGIDMKKTPDWMWLQVDDVVRTGLTDLRRGRAVSVPNWKYKMVVWGMRHLPRRLVSSVSRDVRGRTGRTVASDRQR
jgi:short-subunit dehydrogenase